MITAYADSSFLVQLLISGSRGDAAAAVLQRSGLPFLYFSALHELEVPNAIRVRTFAAAGHSSKIRANALREQTEALRRLGLNLKLGRFRPLRVEWEEAFAAAAELSERFATKFGARSFDLLHVQLAIISPSNHFLTSDARQAKLAKAAGLRVMLVPS